MTLFFITTFILNGSNNVKFSANLTWVGLFLTVFLNYLFIPKHGITGAALATACTSVFLMIISLALATKIFGKILVYKSILKSLAAVLATTLIFWFIPRSSYTLVPLALSYILVYFIFLYSVGEFTKKDFYKLKESFVKKKPKRGVRVK